jgi:nucleoid-associated protein YgaU
VSTAASVIPVVPATPPAPAPLAVKPVVRTPGVPSAETDLLPRPTGSPARYTAVHKTAAGESLPSLAEKYYGNRSRWTDIYEANKDKIEKGSLQPGHILIIP